MFNLKSIYVREHEATDEQEPTNELLWIGHAYMIWYGQEICGDDFCGHYNMSQYLFNMREAVRTKR